MSLDFPSDIMTADFEALQERQGLTCVFGMITFTAVVSDIGKNDRTEDAGFVTEYALSIQALTADLTTVPSFGDTITVNGTDYQVMRIHADPVDVVIRFDLDTPHR